MDIPIPENEPERLAYLQRTQLEESGEEDVFEAIVRLARAHFAMPIVLMSLVDKDRQWFKAKSGITLHETCRGLSFCTHAIMQQDVMVVPDAREDGRFQDNALVTGEPHIRFYAGAPLIMPAGIILGTLCLIDTKPRHDFSDEQAAALADMATVISHIIELRVTVNA